jgi:hypothetical protein
MSGEQLEVSLKATARKVRALTGGIFYPKPDGFPNIRSIVPKASLSVPKAPPPVPFFPMVPQWKSHRPHWRQGCPQRTGGRPQFFCDFPHCTDGFPQFPGHVSQFFSRRHHLQCSVPKPFTKISSSKPSNPQLKTDYEP